MRPYQSSKIPIGSRASPTHQSKIPIMSRARPAQTVRTHGACVLNNQHSPHALNRKPRLHLGRTNRASVPVKQNSNRVPSGIPLNPLWIIAVLIPPFDIRPYVIHNTVTVERSSNNMVMIAIVPTELYAMTFSK